MQEVFEQRVDMWENGNWQKSIKKARKYAAIPIDEEEIGLHASQRLKDTSID